MDATNRLKRARILFAAPALALVMAACGGTEDGPAAATTTAAAATTEVTEPTVTPTEAPDEPQEPTAAPAPSDATDEAAPAEPAATEPDTAEPETEATESSRPPIQRLSADEAILNAAASLDNLRPAQPADNVLDMEVLAVGDGSIQTLRDVVDGDRPVLLWFFSPH